MSQYRTPMPKKKHILYHWYERLVIDYAKYSMDLVSDLSDEYCGERESDYLPYKLGHKKDQDICTSICFACDTMAGTERAHIEPYHKTGNNDCENLHLLCKECHLESETIESREAYFNWFVTKNHTNSGSHLRLVNKAKMYANFYEQGRHDLIPDDLLSELNTLILAT